METLREHRDSTIEMLFGLSNECLRMRVKPSADEIERRNSVEHKCTGRYRRRQHDIHCSLSLDLNSFFFCFSFFFVLC